MTKTQARAEATRHMRRAGWFHPQVTQPEGWVTCPRCPDRITAVWLAWEKPTPALRAQLTTHLIDEH